jgi:hypothetical protein
MPNHQRRARQRPRLDGYLYQDVRDPSGAGGLGYHCRRRQPVALPDVPIAGTECVAHGHRTLLRGRPAVRFLEMGR